MLLFDQLIIMCHVITRLLCIFTAEVDKVQSMAALTAVIKYLEVGKLEY